MSIFEYFYIDTLMLIFIPFLMLASVLIMHFFWYRKLLHNLTECDNRFRVIYDFNPDPMVLIDFSTGRITDCNAAALVIFGLYDKKEIIDKTPADISPPYQDDGQPSLYKSLEMILLARQNGKHHFEWVCKNKNGELFFADAFLTFFTTSGIDTILTTFRDITKSKHYQKELEQVAHYDPLTQLPNRSYLYNRLNTAIAESKRYGRLLALIFLDLDGFKSINDTYGHTVGDHLLVTISNRLLSVLRQGDTLARIGGDEFVAIVGNIDNRTDIEPTVQRMLNAASDPVVYDNQTMNVSVSIGVAFFPADTEDADELIKHADYAMYQAKEKGKNRFCIYGC